MSVSNASLQLPDYKTFVDSISALDLPISGSELHGVLCGYLAAGHSREGEGYLRALMLNRSEASTREAALALFGLYTVSQHQMANMGFSFQLFLPSDDESIYDRARAFSEWCEGFSQGMTVSGLDIEELKSEEVKEAIQHIVEFANLDYDALKVSEEDEKALFEVIEYTRMAILHIYADAQHNQHSNGSETAH